MYGSIKSRLSESKGIQRLRRVIRGNSYGISSIKSQKNRVNLEYSHKYNLNLGDAISPVIVSWMLQKEGLSLGMPVASTRHLMAVGSIVDRGSFDVTVWGSGILSEHSRTVLKSQRGVRKIDIRAVRGPITRDAIVDAGFTCPKMYGDPAILLPYIYKPTHVENQRDGVALVLHHATKLEIDAAAYPQIAQVSICTSDYKSFVDELVQARYVISSSLHGIILAESYGIPAIYLWEDSAVGRQRVKFDDWYLSTGRQHAVPARSINEALQMEPPEVPNLNALQDGLMRSFPYDLWS